MTTAKLSLGLDTSAAKTSLKDLRDELKKLPQDLNMKATKLSFTLDTKGLSAELSKAMQAIGPQKVSIDTGGAASEFTAMSQALKTTVASLQSTLDGFADKFAEKVKRTGKAAKEAADTVAGAGGTSDPLGRRASTRLGAKDPSTGVSYSVTAKANVDDALGAIKSIEDAAKSNRQLLQEQTQQVYIYRQKGAAAYKQMLLEQKRDLDEHNLRTKATEAEQMQQVYIYRQRGAAAYKQSLLEQKRDLDEHNRRTKATEAEQAQEVFIYRQKGAAAYKQSLLEQKRDLDEHNLRTKAAEAEQAQQVYIYRQKGAAAYKQMLQQQARDLEEYNLKVAAMEKNARFEAASPSSQLRMARLGMALSNQGIDPTSRIGSTAAGLANPAGIAHLEAQAQATKRTATAAHESNLAHMLLNKTFNDIHSSARGIAGSMGAIWLTWGQTLPLAAGAALGASLRQAFMVGKDLEYQLKFVSVLTGEATVSMKDFSAAVRGAMVSPTEAASAMRGLAQNGLSATQALQALPNILNLATAGEMSLQEAALGATGVMAAFNLQVTDLGRIGDVFAKAAALSNTSVNGMMEAMKQASTIADQFNVSLEQTAASLAVLAKRNIEGSAAGTAIRNMMTELGAPTKKASEAMKQMGINVYDSQGKLKDYNTILQTFHDKLALMGEESKNAFLSDVFNERGVKAINALMSDFSVFKTTLDEVTNKSKDFAATITQQLGETTQGKLRALFTEFQMSAVEAFNSSSSGLNHFIDTLRLAAGSDDFKKLMESTLSGVTSLTKFLIEHSTAVLTTVAAYVAMRSVAGVVSLFLELKAAMTAAGVAITGVRVAMLGLASAMTGGLALIATLAAEYFLLSDNTDKATEAEKQYRTQLELSNKTGNEAIARLEKQNNLMFRTNQLIRDGMSAEAARKQAESEAGKTDVQKAKFDLETQRKRVATLQAKADEYGDNTMGGGGSERKKAFADLLSAQETLKQMEIDVQVKAAGQIAKETNEAQSQFFSNSSRLQALNNRIKEALEQNGAIKLKPMMQKEMNDLANLSKEEFDKAIKAREAMVNAAMTLSYKKRDPRAESVAHQEAKSEVSAAKKKYDDDNANTEALYQGKTRIEQAYSQYKLKSQTEVEENISKLNEEHLLKRIERAKEFHAEMERLKSLPNLNAADRKAADTELGHADAMITKLQTELAWRKQIEEIKVRSVAENYRKDANKVDSSVDADVAKIARGPKLELMGAKEKAETEAAFAVIEKYRELRLKVEEEVAMAIRGGNEAAIAEANQRLEDLNARIAGKVSEAKTAAGTAQDERTSVNYGFKSWWKAYEDNAKDSASTVRSIMNSTTKSMEDSFANFVTTGKLNFKSLTASIMADAARAMASKAMTQLFMMAGNYLIGSFGGSAGASGWGTTGSAGTSAGFSDASAMWTSAYGNVMTDYGPMQLQRYSDGGIARRPQLSMFGEGSQPEAYVPLPDGRSIPVTMEGASGGGNQNNVTISIQMANDGTSKVDSQTQGKQAVEMSRAMEAAVMQVLNREKRPGGVLYT